METHTINEIKVIGIAVRTTNQNGQSAQDIPALWNRFMTEGIAEKIPGKVDDTLYCIYTDYVSDHTEPYTAILGCEVRSLDTIPEGMVGPVLPAGRYARYLAKGNLAKGAVVGTWQEIWSSDLARKYTADYEVYGERAQNPEDAEVDIFVAIQP